MATQVKTSFNFDGTRIPVRVKSDWRNSVRFSITQKSINITIPKYYTRSQLQEELYKLKEWSIQQFRRDPSLFHRFMSIVYTHNEFIQIYGELFQLKLEYETRKSCSAKINKEKQVIIKVPDNISEHDQHSLIGQVLSRVFSSYFTKAITARVQHYNREYFQEHIESVRLKNNQSNWGSCSSEKNINLSSRLLFAPTDVLDYVIIHELAHLKEMNHSDRFWKIVRDIMPNYKEKEDWLDKHGHTLRY